MKNGQPHAETGDWEHQSAPRRRLPGCAGQMEDNKCHSEAGDVGHGKRCREQPVAIPGTSRTTGGSCCFRPEEPHCG